MRNNNEKYCFNCGAVIDSKMKKCPICGVDQPDAVNQTFNSRWLMAFLLCLVLGSLGIHRFYLNRVGTGILMLITLGGCGVWYIIDLVLLIVGGLRDGDGVLVKPNF